MSFQSEVIWQVLLNTDRGPLCLLSVKADLDDCIILFCFYCSHTKYKHTTVTEPGPWCLLTLRTGQDGLRKSELSEKCSILCVPMLDSYLIQQLR